MFKHTLRKLQKYLGKNTILAIHSKYVYPLIHTYVDTFVMHLYEQTSLTLMNDSVGNMHLSVHLQGLAFKVTDLLTVIQE